MPLIETSITLNLCQNGRRGNGAAARIAVYKRKLLYREIDLNGVDEEVVRLQRQRLYSSAHRQPGGLVDVDLIDFEYVGAGDGPAETACFDVTCEILSFLGTQDFAVVETANGLIGIQDNCPGEHGSEQAAAADFVYARDAAVTLLAREALIGTDATDLRSGLVLRHKARRWRTTPARAGVPLYLLDRAGNRAWRGGRGRYAPDRCGR